MRYENHDFGEGQVILDGNEFVDCRFEKSVLVISGVAPTKIENCTLNGVRFGFTGPAQSALRFLSALYRGAGTVGVEIVEGVFADVRSGAVARPSATPPAGPAEDK